MGDPETKIRRDKARKIKLKKKRVEKDFSKKKEPYDRNKNKRGYYE